MVLWQESERELSRLDRVSDTRKQSLFSIFGHAMLLARSMIALSVASPTGSTKRALQHEQSRHAQTGTVGTGHGIGFDNCSLLVKPVDPSPVRSPQAVHSVLLELFRNKTIVEIGTRNGDGIACFARAARAATAIEIDDKYCRILRERSTSVGATYNVACQDYRKTCLDADFYTWWQQQPFLTNEAALVYLGQQMAAGGVRPSAEAVLLFDHSWHHDMKSWRRLAPLARAHTTIAFNEREQCFRLMPTSDPDRKYCHSRSFGNFTIALVPIARVRLLPSTSMAMGEADGRDGLVEVGKPTIQACRGGMGKTVQRRDAALGEQSAFAQLSARWSMAPFDLGSL